MPNITIAVYNFIWPSRIKNFADNFSITLNVVSNDIVHVDETTMGELWKSFQHDLYTY